MRDFKSLLEFKGGFIGTLCKTGAETAFVSCCGNSIDTHGFSEMLATLFVGVGESSAGGAFKVDAKFQEASEATGPYTDISDGALTNSAAFTTLDGLIYNTGGALSTVTLLGMGSIAERLSDGRRKRFIRVNAYATGTADHGRAWVPVAVTVLLGRPRDTLYLTRPTTAASGNNGWVPVAANSHGISTATA